MTCPICRASAIDHLAQAKPIFGGLIEWINRQGLLFNNLQLRIELRNRKQLAEFLREPGDTQCLGATLHTTHTLNGRATRTEVNGVAILRGLPATLFQAVTIHELGHAWLAVHGIMKLSRQEEEGFCEFVAHRYLTHTATKESLYHASGIARNPDTIYGEGYRLVSKIVATTGFSGVLRKLQTDGRLS
ncbi:MAG: protein DA1 [Anaerolineae bacterium]|nr:MAG: protein DA1 [Anaerolineae bacterium]